MLGRLSLIGGIMLTFSASLLGYQPASATDTIVAENRPTASELQSALQQIESLGDYQAYFGDSSLPLTADDTAYYQEYNYLHRLAIDIRALIAHYDDAAYLEQHGLKTNIFQDILNEAHDAVRGCSLIFGLNRTVKAPTTTTPSTPSATAPAASTSAPSTTPAALAPSTNISSAKPTIVTTTSATTVKAEAVKTPATPAASEPTTDTITSDATTADPEEIIVPATGETTNTDRQISWPALIAVTITGAMVASIIIALVVRQEPRRRPTVHRPRH